METSQIRTSPSKKIVYSAMVMEGTRLQLESKAIKTRLDFLTANIGKEIEITMSIDSNRSTKQNAFFHSCILPSVQRALIFSGMPKASDTEFVKEVILKKPYLTVNHGTPEEYIRPTSSLDVHEFWMFCKFCIELLVRIGGELNQREQEEYLKIVKKYHLNKALEEATK